MAFNPLLLAQAPGGGGMSMLLMVGAMFAIMYFLLIRPQQKQLREHRALLSSLKKGDEVVTQGGVIGRIYAVTDKIVSLEVANGVRLRVLKSSVQGKATAVDEPAQLPAKTEEKKEEK